MNIEHITLQFEHQIFKLTGDDAKELLLQIESFLPDLYDGVDWDITDRKPLKGG